MTEHKTPLPPNPFMIGDPVPEPANPWPMPTAVRAGLIPAFENFERDYPMLARIKPSDRW